MVNQVVIFNLTTLLNVTEFLSTAFWITATYSFLFSAANSKNIHYNFKASQLGNILNARKSNGLYFSCTYVEGMCVTCGLHI